VNPLQIVWTADKTDADLLTAEGYEPVECAFGSGSSLGQLAMDHHGTESWREGVAIRAYRDHFGARRDDPRFVVTGAADADATFAIAALCGILPHPSRAVEFENSSPSVKTANTRDLTALAELVNMMDTDPIGLRLEESEEGTLLLLWRQLSSSVQDATAFHAGVDRWRSLMERTPEALLNAVKTEEAHRVAEARKAFVTKISNAVSMIESSVWGFDVWYAEVGPIVVAYVAANGNVTIGCFDAEIANRYFGPGGLKNVFPKLQPQGWGGREAIGGSPRGLKLTREQAIAAAQVVADSIL